MYQEEDNNKQISKIILVITGVVSLVFIMIFFFQVMKNTDKKKIYVDNLLVNYVGENPEWAKCRSIQVDYFDDFVKEYSFDNGNNWQTDNIYEVCQNGVITVKIRDKKQKELGKGTINIINIDNITPTIIIKGDLIVKVNEKINLLSDVTAVDNESGINGKISINPKIIDTSKVGNYVVTYQVYDKAGNFSSKKRTIIIE
ncbi:MAG: DUF5011 domain-containing protein [Bacilli bacterium]